MILLLSRSRDTPVPADLADRAEVRVFRAPAPPRSEAGQPTGARWAQRRLAAFERLAADGSVEMVTCADARTLAFAWRIAEAFPDIPVLSDPAVAARAVAMVRERGLPCTAAAVRGLLDAGRPRHVTAPAYLTHHSARPAMVVSLVGTTVVNDSRVLRTARSLVRFGYDSVVVGRAPRRAPDGDYFLTGDSLVLRAPVTFERLDAQLAAPPGGPLVRLLGYRSRADEAAAAHRLELRRPDARRPVGLRGRLTRWRATISGHNRQSFVTREERMPAHRLRASLHRRGLGPRRPRAAYPAIADFDQALTPLVVSLWPDVIHVHDPVVLEAAVQAQQELSALGHQVRLVYDAHAWTPDLQLEHALHAAALARSEEEHARRTDAVITVSDEMADRLTERLQLAQRPAVVADAPEDGVDPQDRDVRADVGLSAGTPLAVTGEPLAVGTGGIAEGRVTDAVQALTQVPDLHLVVMARPAGAWRALLLLARDIGVADRVHRVDEVPGDRVASYVRRADVGLVPVATYRSAEHVVPTTLREFLVAGLPIVATDASPIKRALRDSGVGEVYPGGSVGQLADALRRVLGDADRYRRAITPALRQANSWQAQEGVLRVLYAGLIAGPADTATREPEAPEQLKALEAAAEQPVGSPVDVLIGGTNSAGQAGAWARALRGAGVRARSLELRSPDNPFSHAVDSVIPRESVDSLDRQVQVMLREVAPAGAVIMESLMWLAAPEPGSAYVRTWGFREARELARAGRNVGLIFHGSDLRRPDVHARTHRWSPFAHPSNDVATNELRVSTRFVHEHLARWSGPVMVSTPDLIGQTAGAVWVPVVIDLERFRPPTVHARHDRPVVVHLPSRSLLKGSHLIDPVLQDLAGRGLISYRRYTDVPHDSVPGILEGADIFVDQLGMGILGVAALEAMAMGVAVVTDPGPEALVAYDEPVPVVPVDPDTLGDAVAELAADVDRRRSLAEEARPFVERHHDGRRSAAAMMSAMGLDRL